MRLSLLMAVVLTTSLALADPIPQQNGPSSSTSNSPTSSFHRPNRCHPGYRYCQKIRRYQRHLCRGGRHGGCRLLRWLHFRVCDGGGFGRDGGRSRGRLNTVEGATDDPNNEGQVVEEADAEDGNEGGDDNGDNDDGQDDVNRDDNGDNQEVVKRQEQDTQSFGGWNGRRCSFPHRKCRSFGYYKRIYCRRRKYRGICRLFKFVQRRYC